MEPHLPCQETIACPYRGSVVQKNPCLSKLARPSVRYCGNAREKFSKVLRNCALGGCGLLLSALCEWATAQSTTELETITVTAERVARDAQRVPISITTINGALISFANVTQIEEISQLAANTVFAKNFLHIRGIGSAATFGFDPPVGYFVDDVYIGRSTAVFTPTWDIQQIDIIRGPQGVLLGKNTIGGGIAVTTQRPDDTFGLGMKAKFGSYIEADTEAWLNVPVGESLALRASAVRQETEGYMFNTTQGTRELGRDNKGLRLAATYDAEAIAATLILEESSVELFGLAAQLAAVTPASLALYQLYDPNTEANLDDYRTSYDGRDTGGLREADSATLHLIRDGEQFDLVSVSNVAAATFEYRADVDYSPAPLLYLSLTEDYQQFSQEFRLTGHWRKAEITAGVYGLRSELDVDSAITSAPDGTLALANRLTLLPVGLPLSGDFLDRLGGLDIGRDSTFKAFHQRASNLAVYGNIEYPLSERWRIAAGLRWTREHKALDMRLWFEDTGILFTQFLGEEAFDTRQRRQEIDVSPRAVLHFDWTSDIHLYAMAGRGHKGGGYNDLAATVDTLEYEGEQAQSYEVGAKTRWLDNALEVNLAAFRTRHNDLQVTHYDGARFYVANAAQVLAKGLELEARWIILPGLTLFGNVARLDARFESFPNAPARADQAGDSQDLSGQRKYVAPEYSGFVGLQYRHELPLLKGFWTVYGDMRFRADTSLSLDNDPIDFQPAYRLLSAGVSLGLHDGSIVLRLTGQNLGNELIRNSVNDVPLFAGDHWAELEPPRRLSLALELGW